MKKIPSSEPHGTDHLIEKQMLFWSVRHKAGREESLAFPLPWKFLTLSRDEGSLGEEIARELGEKLNWQVCDREIVDFISRESQTRESLVQQLDEHDQSLMEDAVRRLFGMFEGVTLGIEEYHHSLVHALEYLAHRGKAILVGRGSNFVLRGQPGLHLRITGSPEVRASRLSAARNVPLKEAERQLREIDEERKAFIRRHFKQDINNPCHYDLVVNTDRMDAERAASLILASMQALAAYSHL